jgi:hypothetical protein
MSGVIDHPDQTFLKNSHTLSSRSDWQEWADLKVLSRM